MIGRRTGITALVVVLMALAAYGLQSTATPRDAGVVGSAEAFVCALPQDVGGFLTPPSPFSSPGRVRPPPGTVPDTFTPVMAVVCDIDLGNHVAADGTATYVERHYTGDFDSAIEALNAPSARRSMFCGTYGVAAPVDMWLVDADGRAMEPSYPLSDCGIDNTLGLYEIVKLDETAAVEHSVRIDAAGISRFFDCSPVSRALTPGPESLTDFPWLPSGFCRFDTSDAVPLFLGADRYDVDSGPDAFDVLGDLAPAAPCAQRATSLATFSLSPSPVSNTGEPLEVHVELDGCRRILADGYQSLSAPTEFVDALALAAG
ncbi:hypothetical protein E5720_09920 [Rhodococcus sp. PAMC28707]|uniref:hypothetical protein n=1 Tax=unclassified Rhodococcus (in: high G+C Gram-positive bacteria) TaxID=192944 RepID=UPI00109DF466|nr:MULTISPECIES: hypothetical protein [unclassified Rhodococcus (in: high G+C Gram-positive bacteria)]QCB49524.1 hypothetical protein E5769_04095 [Rhodococcus sp. PAMC28705]QCB58786.1 hypothetical protein E5720_09920 [Rhodococcus sp. PAMC28707]